MSTVLAYEAVAGSPQVIVLDLYCRISRDYDGTLRSVEDQEELGREAVEELDERSQAFGGPRYVVGRVFRDHALSAWKRGVVRAEWVQLMARLDSGEAQGVWVRDLDRFTRKVREGLDLLDMAERGRRVFNQYGEYDLKSPEGRQHFRDDLNKAETESEKISARVKRGKMAKAKRGKSNATTRGFGRPGYLPRPEGWEKGDPLERVPDEVVAVEREEIRGMAQALLRGESLGAIAADLNERGVLTTRGNTWTSVAVRNLLRTPSIAGLVAHNGKVLEGKTLAGEPAVDRETWDALVSHFSGRTRGRPATSYLLSGLLLCGVCGEKLYGRPRTGTTYPDGEVRRQYWCQKDPGNHRHGCTKVAIDQRFADEMVEQAVLERLGDPGHIERVRKVAEKVQGTRDQLRAEIGRLERDKVGLASKTHEWGLAAVEQAMAPIVKDLARLREEYEALGDPEQPGESMEEVRSDWELGTLAQRRYMTRQAFPNGIVVLPSPSTGKASRSASRFVWHPEVATRG